MAGYEFSPELLGEDFVVSSWSKAAAFDADIIKSFTLLQGTVSSIHDIRNQGKVGKREPLALFVNQRAASEQLLGANAGAVEYLRKAGALKSVELTTEAPANALPFLFGNDKAYLVLNETIDTEAENAKINV